MWIIGVGGSTKSWYRDEIGAHALLIAVLLELMKDKCHRKHSLEVPKKFPIYCLLSSCSWPYQLRI